MQQQVNSSEHILLTCPWWEMEQGTILDGHTGPARWRSIPETAMRPKPLLLCMASTCLIKREQSSHHTKRPGRQTTS